MTNALKLLIAAVSLALAGVAGAAVSKPEPLKLSVSLKLPAITPVVKAVSLKEIVTKVVQKLDDRPKPVLVAIVNIVKNLPKGNHGGGNGHGNGNGNGHGGGHGGGHHGPPPYGCGSGGGGHGCGCHASKH